MGSGRSPDNLCFLLHTDGEHVLIRSVTELTRSCSGSIDGMTFRKPT
jgi:hypothetical protein